MEWTHNDRNTSVCVCVCVLCVCVCVWCVCVCVCLLTQFWGGFLQFVHTRKWWDFQKLQEHH